MNQTVFINLSSQQQDKINLYIKNEKYADGYNYVKNIVDNSIPTTTDQNALSNLRILSNWLGNAASITSNDGSVKSEFVRGYTVAYGFFVGKPVTEAKFQKVSND